MQKKVVRLGGNFNVMKIKNHFLRLFLKKKSKTFASPETRTRLIRVGSGHSTPEPATLEVKAGRILFYASDDNESSAFCRAQQQFN